MGGAINSLGGFLGLSDGPKISADNRNSSLGQLAALNGIYSGAVSNKAQTMNDEFAMGRRSLDDTLSDINGLSQAEGAQGFDAGALQRGLINDLATGPLSGSVLASQQVQNDPIMGQLFGKGGQLSSEVGEYGKQSGLLDKLQNQGYQLTPEDQTLYGQASGNIARQFGQQGNQMANDLASRGLSASGAAGAQFSGLAGNQNEQLAQAQQQIMQQRFQNTMNQIGQTQQFMSSLGNNIGGMGQLGAGAINQQYGRQLQGAQLPAQQIAQTAGLQLGQNKNTNESDLAAQNFNQANQPMNFMDYATTGVGQGFQAGLGGTPGASGKVGDQQYSRKGSGAAGVAGGLF